MTRGTIRSRRQLLRGGALGAAALGSVVGVSAVGGCTPGPPAGAGGPGAGSLTPPTYVPFPGVRPDLPGDGDGVVAGFLGFPEPAESRPGFPLPETAPVTALTQGRPPQLAPASNPAYEVFRRTAGNQMDAVTVVSPQYLDKFQVTVASDDLPDFVQIVPVPQLPKLLERHFTDLTDVLGGAGVTRYPGLANIPPPTWRIPVVKGRLWGIAQPRPPAGRILSTRGDLLAERGLEPSPALGSGDDFVALLEALTDGGENRFALGSDPTSWLLQGLLEMFEAPNNWAVAEGRFVHQVESEQMKEALAAGIQIIDRGLLHPNSFSDPSQNQVWWRSGVTALYFQAFTGWGDFARQYPDWNVGHVRLPRWYGDGKAPIHLGPAGYAAFIAIKKQPDDQRLEELLRLADFIASPFGTQEFLDVHYGSPGDTYALEKEGPRFLPGQSVNVVAGWPYCGGNAQAVLFQAGQAELTRTQHRYLTEAIPSGVADASEGLYSETAVSKGATWDSRLGDAKRAILLGERPVTYWDEVVRDWRSAVGDQMAGEFEEAAAQ